MLWDDDIDHFHLMLLVPQNEKLLVIWRVGICGMLGGCRRWGFWYGSVAVVIGGFAHPLQSPSGDQLQDHNDILSPAATITETRGMNMIESQNVWCTAEKTHEAGLLFEELRRNRRPIARYFADEEERVPAGWSDCGLDLQRVPLGFRISSFFKSRKTRWFIEDVRRSGPAAAALSISSRSRKMSTLTRIVRTGPAQNARGDPEHIHLNPPPRSSRPPSP